jgi:UTP:GlnB (protein PII) uridylyltransferase
MIFDMYILIIFISSCVDYTVVLDIVLDVTEVLSELELTIQRVKVTTTPDGKVLDLFIITDNM